MPIPKSKWFSPDFGIGFRPIPKSKCASLLWNLAQADFMVEMVFARLWNWLYADSKVEMSFAALESGLSRFQSRNGLRETSEYSSHLRYYSRSLSGIRIFCTARPCFAPAGGRSTPELRPVSLLKIRQHKRACVNRIVRSQYRHTLESVVDTQWLTNLGPLGSSIC